MTCTCGHHQKAHLGERGLCGSPHGCNCNKFVPEPAEIPVDILSEAWWEREVLPRMGEL